MRGRRHRPPRCARCCCKAHSCANPFNASGLAAGTCKADICLSGNVTATIATKDEDIKLIAVTFTVSDGDTTFEDGLED